MHSYLPSLERDPGRQQRRPPPTSLEREIARGAAIGMPAALAAALASGLGLLAAALAVIGGGMLGALIGLLVWCEGADLPEDPVLPPAKCG